MSGDTDRTQVTTAMTVRPCSHGFLQPHPVVGGTCYPALPAPAHLAGDTDLCGAPMSGGVICTRKPHDEAAMHEYRGDTDRAVEAGLRFDPSTYDARRAEVAEMIDEADRQDDYPMTPDGLADALMEIAEGWARALASSRPAAPDSLDVERLNDAIRHVWQNGHRDLGSGLTTDPSDARLAVAIATEYGG